jgi:riboflavin kinase/FMN adenylyltransferase
MRIYRQISEFKSHCRPVATVGVFDGVHRGHLEIINRLAKVANEKKCESVVITFDPHPRLVLPHNAEVWLLNTMDEKLHRFELAGVDVVLVIPFDIEFARVTPHDFIKNILVDQIKASHVITGYDHFFGQNREGDFDLLSKMGGEFGFTVDELPMVLVAEHTVSSSMVRRALLDGDVKLAATMLGYAYEMSGTVVAGNKIGRNIGYPTANIKIKYSHKLIPGQGVYATLVKVDNTVYKAMTNIGFRPTIDADHLTIEANIFDFNLDIYAKEITLSFIDRIRDEKRFASLGDLQHQLANDKMSAGEILKNQKSVI